MPQGRIFGAFIAMALSLALGPFLSSAPSDAGQSDDRPSQAEAPAAAQNGKQVYEKHCAICHYSASAAKKIGPGMKGIYARGKFADGKKVDDASMRVWIEKGGKDMPAYKSTLSAKEIADLIAYLKTL